MIEKRITHQLLETGELALTERECAALSLPEHSSSIAVELDGEQFRAQWSGRSRHLTGDMLAERLQDYGQDGGLLRLRPVDQVYRLQLLPPGTPAQVTIPVTPPPPILKPTVAKAKRRRATVDRQFHADSEYDWGNRSDHRTIGFLKEARVLLEEQLKAAGFDPLELVELRLQGEELATLDDFEELLAVDVANVDRMPHQEAVARHALSRLRGRAVLADEVGLGKTIEAGLAVKELALRGLAKRVLILCPAPLRDQWREEMSHKFDLSFDIAARGPEIKQQDKLILSLHLGSRNAEKLTERPWDIVILDEAHRAAGAGARKTRELITSLTTACRYAFFLTATPVQNDLLELYRLVELLRPGTFTSVSDFKRQFMRSYDPRTPNDPAALRRLISSVMIRTTRAQAGVDRVVRRAVDVPVDLGTQERELYALATHLLRNVMRDSGDTMRRRSLALRLTASPFSMGTTALRMAERHPNPRVQKVLLEIGHHAMDIQSAAREDTALQITRDWVREHGRVLIFTQHTDTVTGLLRRMELEGLTARSFHGSMSAGERAATISAFRSGEAPIMISTDAGAEGQNLQFCNCVLNYDLPWNPMRIEQRIGRVDRLTQPKDEVFVANLYARRTIDESVYRLLAEKLRMFELLFGQVTTILGELDESKSASFETRVLEALFAENDTKMDRLLGQLGTELVHAREKASELIAADSGLSNWMTSAFEHRKGLTKAGSTDLAPEVAERARMRQRRVQAWVRSVLHALHAAILHDTGNGDGAFITARLGEEFEQELGGRTLMHLAFDRFGLEHHPDAELCAVGSPVFDELLGLLRVRGDMHATVPIVPDDLGPTPYRHSPTIRLVRRRLVPSGSWSGQATFRATIGEAETTEHLITADINGHSPQRLPRRPLNDGESLPPAFGNSTKVIAQFERAASSQLESLRRERSKRVETQQAEELARITSGYRAQIYEAHPDDRERLRRALRSEERRLDRRPDIRARAKVLAVTLDEDDWLVEETWAGPGGDEAMLTYEWGTDEPSIVESDASGEPVDVLALCSGAHWVDVSETSHCGSCDRDLCSACGDDAVFADCAVCGLASCGECRCETGGLCRLCASPQRAPELDDEFSVAWTLNAGCTLRVGERAADLIKPGASSSFVLVSAADAGDPHRARLRAYARQHDLPLDCGLRLRDLTGRPELNETARARLAGTQDIEVELSVEQGNDASMDVAAFDGVPAYEHVPVTREEDLHLGAVLQRLRTEVPPPPRPALVVTRRSTFVDVLLEEDRLVREVSVVADDGSPRIHDTATADIQWRDHSLDDAQLGHAKLADIRITVTRRNEAVQIDAYRESDQIGSWVACPEDLSVAEQFGCFNYLKFSGTPGGRLGKRTDEVLTITGAFPTPSECEVIQRSIKPIVNLVELDSDFDIVPADGASLAAFGIAPDRSAAQRVSTLPPELASLIIGSTQRPFTAALCNGLEVSETWRGHGTAEHTYQTFDGEPLTPKADDIGIRQSDFGVCRDGHFYAAGTAALCAACESWACRACDPTSRQASVTCPGCSSAACPRCLAGTHAVSTAQCLLCGDHACTDCGRDPNVAACDVCERIMCGSCREGDLCPACNRLEPVNGQQRELLPAELVTDGATLLVGTDDDASVVVINRGGAYEHATVRNGTVIRWIAFGRREVDSAYRLRLSASLRFGTQVVPVIEPLDPEEPRAEGRVVVHTERAFTATWAVSALGASGRVSQAVPNADGDLPSSVAEQFPSLGRFPTPAWEIPNHLRPRLAALDRPTTADLALHWNRVGRDVTVTAEGLRELEIDGTMELESSTAFREGEATPQWVLEAWQPTPQVRLFSQVPGVDVVLVSMASLIALGTRAPTGVDWYVVTASQQAPTATALSRSMNLGDADEVGVFTDPRRIRLSGISNAAGTSLAVTPRGNITRGPRSYESAALDALSAWLPEAHVKAPQLQVLPHELRLELQRLVQTDGCRQRLDVGASIVEMVTVDDGHEWRYEMLLAPGQTDARRFDQVTRQLLEYGGIDREGHFGLSYAECGYCGGKCCILCIDGIVACDCCAAPICKRCVQEPYSGLYLCHACTSTRPPTRQEARTHGRLLFTRGMLIGTDALHTVVVEQAKSRWTIHGADGAKHPIANPSVTKYLDHQIAESDD
ncbi:ATP-dependent helicase [Mycobacterium sp. PS03-16]|uniref:SNF2-related protein n=1 Tax=Mycobacterium sp. PS03-16 TaxID=2559611 RepID=UPI0010738A75|nr:SNF2-related protein [Mycobacterium sp. PS03-16]TFV61501.1 ATP-dependent helicase [Mycobacterium sp. PS03-16]